MYFSREFINENPDFRFLVISDREPYFCKCLKIVASYITSSVRFTVTYSLNLRRYITMKSSVHEDTIGRLCQIVNNDLDTMDTILTDNGVMITHINVKSLNEKIDNCIIKWMNRNSPSTRRSKRDSGLYKRLLRLKIIFDHVDNIYSDKYNIYQAAYISKGYSLRAGICFVVQIVSVLALVTNTDDDIITEPRSILDYVLIFVTIMYMFLNIPSKYVTSDMSHGLFLMKVFHGLGMYTNVLFVFMNILVNTIVVISLPMISAKLLSGTAKTAEIVTRSLSVLFVTGLDDQAISKGESNRLLVPQTQFLKNMVERVDTCSDSDRLQFIKYIPWVENIALLVSISLSYYILLG